jgi:hypothetical protein
MNRNTGGYSFLRDTPELPKAAYSIFRIESLTPHKISRMLSDKEDLRGSLAASRFEPLTNGL